MRKKKFIDVILVERPRPTKPSAGEKRPFCLRFLGHRRGGGMILTDVTTAEPSSSPSLSISE